MVNWGVRAHDFGRWSVEESARRIGEAGFTCIQLALPKALLGFEPAHGGLNSVLARGIREAYAAQGIRIAVLGCYINPVEHEEAALEASVLRFEELLRFAGDFGCPVVATETGPVDTVDGFNRLVTTFRRLALTAERHGVRIGVEGVAHHHVIHTHQLMQRLLDEVNSPSMGVIYDPANFLSVADEGRLGAALADAVARFGSRLLAVHAKDCRLEAGVKTSDLPAGFGHVPYRYLLHWLQVHHPGMPVLLEEVGPETWRHAKDYLEDAALMV
jgi:sugar phosphate isomerase/epimerase